jgi:hypothetical protein
MWHTVADPSRLTSYRELSKYPALNNFESQTSVPKVYVVLGLGALYFFLVFFNIAAEFLVNTVGFAIPAYYSLNALFTSGKADDSQWLTVGDPVNHEMRALDILTAMIAVLGRLRLLDRF